MGVSRLSSGGRNRIEFRKLCLEEASGDMPEFSCFAGFVQAISRFVVSGHFKSTLAIIVIVSCWIAERAAASVISFSGEDINAQSWRTTSVTKPLISDGSGIYGKDGYAVFAIAPN